MAVISTSGLSGGAAGREELGSGVAGASARQKPRGWKQPRTRWQNCFLRFLEAGAIFILTLVDKCMRLCAS